MPTITASLIGDLRARTNAALRECRQALAAADGNLDKAEELLRAGHGADRPRTELSQALARFPGFEEGYEAARRQQEFGRRLRALREEKGLSQSALAEQAKVDQGDISRFEAGKWGKRGVSFERLERILPILGLRLEHRVSFADDGLANPASREAVEAMGALL